MSGSESPNDGGVRRRHSAHHHEGLDGVRDSENDGVRTGTRSIDEHRRVRFSEDAGSRLSHKRRKSDEASDNEGNGERSSVPDLSLDTRAAAEGRVTTVLGEGTVKSPSSAMSPVSSPQYELGSPRKNRGMSLRSSLFMRNIGRRQSSGIELQDVGPSNGGTAEDARQPPVKKQQTVTVTPVEEKTFLKPIQPATKARTGLALPNYQQWATEHARRHLPLRRIEQAFDRARKFVLGIHDIPPSKDGRHVYLDASRKTSLTDERTGKAYISNLIRSSKYTPWNFLPRQLWAQFGKFANFYFLLISILQMIPGLSTTGNYTTIIPLLFFVSISMGKEGYEDLRRHRLDKAENNRQAKVLRKYQAVAATAGDAESGIMPDGPAHWSEVKWQSIQVGDVVKLERDEAVPADIIILGSKGPNSTAYIETMALDGETNLKPKQPISATVGQTSNTEALVSAQMEVVVEDPNLDLHNFEGKLITQSNTYPLTNNEIIYRGSIIRNTPEIIGIVIYSGEECKIRMNANKDPRVKSPQLQGQVNKIVFGIACFVVFLAIYNSIAYKIWQTSTERHAWYILNAPVAFGPLIVSFIIMFNTLIPLSLYVSLEIIKVAQMFLLNDVDMYDPESNTPFEARTSTINEELGQVGYIFSDKTGTLTENVMRFRKMSVAGTAWLHDTDLQDGANEELLMHKKRRQSKGKRPVGKPRKSTSRSVATAYEDIEASEPLRSDRSPQPPKRSNSQWTSSALPGMESTEQSTQLLIRHLQRHPNTAFASRAKMMILSMALCHTCLPERTEDDDGEEDVAFQASSPDELALVDAAKELGYLAYERDASTLTLKTYPHGRGGEAVFESYEILDVVEFSSKRKRMSTVVRLPDGKVCIICKGADSMIMSRLRLAAVANQKLSEIEKRAMHRKSMEAQEALRRKSSMYERQGSVTSMPRTSNSLARRSTTMNRPSIGKLEPIRDEVDTWLNDREQDVVQSPRYSAHFRPSMALSEFESEPLVDDALATDDNYVLERCLQHINDFATEGLRTLLYGYRFLEEEEYHWWKKIYHDATTSLVNRQEMIEKAGEVIEQQLELGGATAIEDKLQKDVPETIDRLRRANIKMWMLTGDKRETAVNIAHTCRLIKDYSAVTVLDYEAGHVEENIAASIIDINRGDIAHAVVVVDGQTLATIQTDEALSALFLDLAILTDSVICCRASPSQKADLVHAIRIRLKGSVTLAIGDGANDIAMIREAQVGIGITGKEGLQAARTSDYAVAQFRFLAKLLLVHGHWNYVRTCKYVLGTFSKEMMFYLTQALYQRYNGYSGTSMYESWSLSMFNTLFTSLTVIFLGVFEQDLRASTLLAVPELYTKGQRSGGFNIRVYLGWIFVGVSESMIIFFTVWGLWGHNKFTGQFHAENDLFPLGNLVFTACVIVITLKLQVIENRYKSIMAVIGCFLCIGGWWLWQLILGAIYQKNHEYNVKGGIFERFGRSLVWWLVLLLAVTACCLYEVGLRALKAAFFPTDIETFQVLEGDLSVRKRFEEAAAPWMREGWDRGSKKSSLELKREREEEIKREGEIEELLSRPRTMEEGFAGGQGVGLERVETRREEEEQEVSAMLGMRFGHVRNERMNTVSLD